jgi:hypothetical protein
MRTILLGLFSAALWGQTMDEALLRYLQLSEQQALEIGANAERFAAEQKSFYDRVNALNRELESETRRATPDTGALGTRYREIETLCREAEAPRRGLYERQMALLSEGQRERVRAIEGSLRLAVLAWEAEAFHLLAPAEGLGRNVLFSRGIGAVGDHLELSEAQRRQVEEKTAAHREFLREREARMAAVREEIEAEFGRTAPGAAELGERYWELEAHRRQMAARAAELRREIDALLTAAQRGQVAELARAREAYALQGLAAQWGLRNVGDVPMPASRPPLSFLSVPILRDPFPGGIIGSFGAVDVDSVARNCLYGPEYVPLPITRVRTSR